MQKVNYVTNPSKTYLRVYIVIFVFMLSMISFNAAFGQKKPKNLKINGKEFKHIQRTENTNHSAVTCPRLPNRTIDGTCNNITTMDQTIWGAADIELFRNMPASYGAPDFHNDMAGNCRLSARAVSNIVVSQSGDILSPRNLSSLVFTWGQFLDHDIDLTPEGHTEFVPVLLPANEPLFTQPIPFLRAAVMDGTGVDNDRQHPNIITSWIDASQVYGSEDTRAEWLRTFSQGKLKTSTGDLLPYNTLTGNLGDDIDPNAPSMAGDNAGTAKVFVAGDVRANEQPGLTALHTLFVREHNRICDQLIQQGMNDDELIYQRARKIVGALMQSITYNGFLPALGVEVAPYEVYDDTVVPDISSIFSTAAYRIGHTMVTNEIPLLDENCEAVNGGSLALLDGFFDPSFIQGTDIHPVLNGLASQIQQKVDAKVVDNLRNFLFPTAGGDPFGLDLASLNIQRGRDHGLPDYNSVRMHFTGQAANDFSDITSDPDLQEALTEAYGNVYDMDLWVGLLSEDPMNGSSVGLTMNNILAHQFEAIRDGDYYFFQNDPAFSGQQRNQISNTTLRQIIERNTPLGDLQNNVFFAEECEIQDNGGDGNGGGGNGGGGNGGGGNGGGGNGGGGNGGGGNGGGGNGGGGNGGGGNGGGGNGGGGNGGGGNGGGGNGGGGNLVQPNPSSILVFPNPSDGNIRLNVSFPEPQEKVTIKVQNIDGKTIHQETTWFNDTALFHDINLEEITPGIYFISVQSETETLTERIIVE